MIVAVPTETAVTNPVLLMVATPVLEDVQGVDKEGDADPVS